MSDRQPNDQQAKRPAIPHTIRRLSVPILLFWVALAALTNIAVPQLEEVGKTHNVALSSPDAPALKAIKRIGQVFHEFDTAERHFSRARLEPELLMVETDHDMRNPADMLILDRVAKAVFHVPGIAQVQTITRPLGTPIDHSSLGFQVSTQSATQQENLTYQRDRADDLLPEHEVAENGCTH
jgi:uncharacterized membrane protein YdfJ with MMPL/SSD domain